MKKTVTKFSIAASALTFTLLSAPRVTAQPDTNPPSVSCELPCPMATICPLGGNDHNLDDVGLGITVSDNEDPNPTVSVDVFSNEDDLDASSGQFSPDAKFASNVLRLRSERSGSAAGRIYLIKVIARDASNNEGFDCCAVVVPHDKSPQSMSIFTDAANAVSDCRSTGTFPATYFDVEDGPVVGNKQ